MTILIDFLKVLEQFIPLFAIYYAGEGRRYYLDSKETRITTLEFDNSAKIFQDTYEWLNKALAVAAGFENIKERGDFDLCNSSVKISSTEIKTLMDFVGIKNGQKKEYTKHSPRLHEIHLAFAEANQLRNAIGHSSTKYDGRTQVIKYFPYTDPEKKDKYKETTLTKYGFQILEMYRSLLELLFICNVASFSVES